MEPTSEAAGRLSGPPRSALVYIYLHTRALSGQHSDPCALSALEPFFGDFSAAGPRFVARYAPSDSPQSRGPCPRAGPPRRGRRAALARWQGRVSAVSHTRPNHSALELLFCDFSAARPRFVAWLARSDSPQSRRPCPRADPCEIADDERSGLFLSLSYCYS